MMRHRKESHGHDRTATAFPAAQAAGRRDIPGRDQLVRGCAWPPRARPPRRYGPTPRRCSGSPPPCLAGQPGQLGAGRQPGHPAVDGVAAGPVQQRLRQQPVPGPAAVLQMAGRRRRAARPDGRAAAAARHRQAGPGLHRARSYRGWSRRARAAASPSAATPRSSRCSRRPASGCPSWPASVHPVTRGAATSTCGSGRSPSAARAARTGSSGSATRPPGAWTGTCAPAPGTRRRGGRSCGWEPATGSR